MPIWLWSLLGFIGVVGLSQVAVIATEFVDRWKKFRQAQAFALSVGKPLLVIGRPGNNRIKVYGPGDVTLDLDPKVLKDCPKTGCVADVCCIPFPDGHFGAVFCSFVLDCLPSTADFEKALRELHRVADGVYICYTRPLNIRWRYLPSEVRLWITQKDGKLQARPRPW